jgi:hypothetical protein
MPPPGQLHTPANLVWYPVPDGDIVTEDFTGWADDVPIMFGATQDEARLFHKPDGLHVPDFRGAADVYTRHTLEIMAQVMGGRRADGHPRPLRQPRPNAIRSTHRTGHHQRMARASIGLLPPLCRPAEAHRLQLPLRPRLAGSASLRVASQPLRRIGLPVRPDHTGRHLRRHRRLRQRDRSARLDRIRSHGRAPQSGWHRLGGMHHHRPPVHRRQRPDQQRPAGDHTRVRNDQLPTPAGRSHPFNSNPSH